MRSAIVAATISLSVITLAAADPVRAAIRQQIHIPPQDLASALQQLTREREVHLVYISEDVRNRQSPGATGDLTVQETLDKLLSGTGLICKYLADGAVTIMPASSDRSPSAPQPGTPRTTREGGGDSKAARGEDSKGFWSRFRLAQAAQEGAGPSAMDTAATLAENRPAASIEEITITAQKKLERLQDVPIPVTVVSAAQMLEKNLLRIQDYAASVPGLNVGLSPSSFQLVSIRGITTASTSANPKVGILIDDVPIGASTHRGGGLFVPDIDPGDLAHVEVLRGPQGTLYGASSLGGLIKYVTLDPDMSRASGRLQTGVTAVRNGDGVGYNLRGSANVPFTTSFAVSASGFTRRESGYIDNLATGRSGINEQNVSGGWLAALWRPSEDLSLRLAALYQDYEGDGPTEVMIGPGIGDLQTSYLRGAGDFRKELQLYSATLKAKLGRVDLTSVSSYGLFDPVSTQDFSTASAFANVGRNTYGVTGAEQYDGRHFRKWTQELRLAAALNDRVDWLLGGFFTRESADQFQGAVAVDPVTARVFGDIFVLTIPSEFKEYAAFGDLTFHLTDRFDVQLGARESRIDAQVTQTWNGPYVPQVLRQPEPLVYPTRNMDANAFTYLVTPRFNVSADLMIYARVATGYGAGGINVVPNTPTQFDSERTKNYELGLKADFLDHRLSLDASLFHIDYTDIQLSFRNPDTGLTHTGNGSAAKSQGIELSVSARPADRLSVVGWVAYNIAELTEPFPAASTARGVRGDRLPATSKFSGHLSIDREFALSGRAALSIGGAASFVGERLGIFTSAPQRQRYPSYTKTDLHARLEYDTWTVNLFVDNVADKRGVLFSDVRGSTPVFFEIQPRTVGLNLVKAF